MVVIHPVGMPLLLSLLLWEKRAKIKQPVEEREKDEEVSEEAWMLTGEKRSDELFEQP